MGNDLVWSPFNSVDFSVDSIGGKRVVGGKNGVLKYGMGVREGKKEKVGGKLVKQARWIRVFHFPLICK